MISKGIKRFCCEDISLIENYEEAVNSQELWDCHHRLETDLNKSVKELKDTGLYWKRSASELIFLSHKEHASLHLKKINKSEKHRRSLSEALKGERNGMYGKHHSEETKLKMKGHISGMKGKHHSEEARNKISLAEKGKIISEETRLKMRLAHTGKKRGKYNKQPKKQVL